MSSSSRKVSNAQMLQRQQRVFSERRSSSRAAQFTRKQSHFMQRSAEAEEEKYRQLQQENFVEESITRPPAPNTIASYQMSSFPNTKVLEKISNPFARTASVRPSVMTASTTQSFLIGNAHGRVASSQIKDNSNKTLDDSHSASTLRSYAASLIPSSVKMTAAQGLSRSERRMARFRLSENDSRDTDLMQVSLPRVWREDKAGSYEHGGGESLAAGEDGAANPASGEEDVASYKRTRVERFGDMIADSRNARLEEQRKRAERDAQTIELDAEFKAVMHLLPRRVAGGKAEGKKYEKDHEKDKKEESADAIAAEQAAFAASGTQEVRELLRRYRSNRSAKSLTLCSDGTAIVASLTNTGLLSSSAEADTVAAPNDPTSAVENRLHTETHANTNTGALTQPSTTAQQATASSTSFKLNGTTATATTTPQPSAGDISYSVRMRTADAPSVSTTLTPVSISAFPDVSRKDDVLTQSVDPFNRASDDFDVLLHQMQLQTRRAHAVERTLDETEEALAAAQRARLAADNAAAPKELIESLQAVGMTQLTRREWLRQGGDKAFQMTAEDEKQSMLSNKNDLEELGEDVESEADVHSDSAGDDEEYEENEESNDEAEGNDEDDLAVGMSAETKHAGKVKEEGAAPRAPLGSRTLDDLLSAIEALVVISPTEQGRGSDTHEKRSKQQPSSLGAQAANTLCNLCVVRCEGENNTQTSQTAQPPTQSADAERYVVAEAEDIVPSRPSVHQHRCVAYRFILRSLHTYASTHALEVANVFRSILIEAQREFLRGRRVLAFALASSPSKVVGDSARSGSTFVKEDSTPHTVRNPIAPKRIMIQHPRSPPSTATLLYIHAMTCIFPCSDYRHAVMTPLQIFLCGVLTQAVVRTRCDAIRYLHTTALLIRTLGGERGALHSVDALTAQGSACGKFAAEAVSAVLNLIALQLPRRALEPVSYQRVSVPFHLLDRASSIDDGDQDDDETNRFYSTASSAAKSAHREELILRPVDACSIHRDGSDALLTERVVDTHSDADGSEESVLNAFAKNTTSTATPDKNSSEKSRRGDVIASAWDDGECASMRRGHSSTHSHSGDESKKRGDGAVQRALRTRVGLLDTEDCVSDMTIILHAYALLHALATMYGDDVAALPAMLSEPFLALESYLISGGAVQSTSNAATGTAVEQTHNNTNCTYDTQKGSRPNTSENDTDAATSSVMGCTADAVATSTHSHQHTRARGEHSCACTCHILQRVHAATAQRLHRLTRSAQDRRAPLAMRSFRPRPIRLFEPLLAEGERAALARENRTVSRTRREDNKREVRRRTAEATVHRRAKENEASHVAANRERVYHQLMGQLQQQQHVMKTVDTIQARAKAGKRSGVSGAPKQREAARGGDDIPVY